MAKVMEPIYYNDPYKESKNEMKMGDIVIHIFSGELAQIVSINEEWVSVEWCLGNWGGTYKKESFQLYESKEQPKKDIVEDIFEIGDIIIHKNSSKKAEVFYVSKEDWIDVRWLDAISRGTIYRYDKEDFQLYEKKNKNIVEEKPIQKTNPLYDMMPELELDKEK